MKKHFRYRISEQAPSTSTHPPNDDVLKDNKFTFLSHTTLVSSDWILYIDVTAS